MLSGYLLDNAEARERLSPQERLYSSNFFVVLGRHLKASVLDELPHHYASLVRSPGSLCLSPTSLPFAFFLHTYLRAMCQSYVVWPCQQLQPRQSWCTQPATYVTAGSAVVADGSGEETGAIQYSLFVVL